MHLSITTPRGAIVEAEVDEVSAPGELGEFGVLPGHVPLMSALKPGVLVYRARDHQGVLAVGPGFLQVAPSTAPGAVAPLGAGAPAAPVAGEVRDRVLVLVDRALTAATVDRAAASKDLADADRELAAWKGELDGAYVALVVRRQWAQARLDAADRSAPH